MPTDKIKILYLIARFHPYKGGAETNCLELAKRMAAAGHDVTVLTTDVSPGDSQLPARESYQGIKIIRVHAWNKQLNLSFSPGMLSQILRIDADIIHYENGPGMIWPEICLLIKKIAHRPRLIATPHGPFLSTPGTHTGVKHYAARVGKLVMWPYFRILWPLLFHNVIAVNPKQFSWLERDYGFNSQRVYLVPNGIPAQSVAAELPLKSEQVLITSVARLARYKGQLHIVQAIAAIKSSYPQLISRVKVILMGKPEAAVHEMSELIHQTGLNDVIEVRQSPSDAARDELVSQSHISILASEWEATGISLLEAMAQGNALITTTGNEAADILIDDAKNGFIYTYGDVSELTNKLKLLVTDSDLRMEMMQASLAKANQFTWEAIFPQYLEVLQGLR